MKAPEMYEDEIARYCRYKKVELAEVFADIDYSGYRGAKPRPALEELKSRRAEFSAVVIPKLSRFGRSMKDLVALFDLFDREGIALVFLDMNIDTSTSQGRLLRHIMAAFAEYESDVKSDYARATQRLMAREGRPHGPLAPFGYTVVGRKAERSYAIDEQAAEIVRWLFHHYLEGGSLNTMAQELNARDVRGPKGGEWSRQRVKTLLDNPAYAAFRVYEGEEFPAAWPALVTRDVFDAVKAKRRASRNTYVDPPGYRNHLLSGLIVCGLCRKNLHHGRSNDRDDIYRCTTGDAKPPRCLGGQIQAARVEKLVEQAVLQLLGLVTDADLQARAEAWRAAWSMAATSERRALLSEVLNTITLLPKPPGNRHGRGLPMGRPIKIAWASAWSVDVFGYVDAHSTLTRDDCDVTSSRGKTWAEYRRDMISARRR